jgi:pilus assembly protein CpaB
MNTQRVIVLGIALVAAGAAAFMVRSLIGGGTPQVQAMPAPPPIAMSEVLVASSNLQPGQKLTPDLVRWEKWPTASVDASFITHASVGSPDEAVKGTVVRVPILAGQPVISTSIVHGDAGGIMAAMLTPGMRAVSIVISAESGAGGFILPNDRVDVILTRKFDGTPPRVVSSDVLSNVRVLAVDQTFSQARDTKTVIGKTATVEVTPLQAGMIYSAQGAGQLSLALRPLGDNQATDDASEQAGKKKTAYADVGAPVNIIRYGLSSANSSNQSQNQNQEKPQ